MKNILKIIIYAFFFCLSPVCYAQIAIVSKLSTDKECNDFNCLDATEKAQITQYLEDIRIKTNIVINVSFFSLPDRKSTRLNSSHPSISRMPSSA